MRQPAGINPENTRKQKIGVVCRNGTQRLPQIKKKQCVCDETQLTH